MCDEPCLLNRRNHSEYRILNHVWTDKAEYDDLINAQFLLTTLIFNNNDTHTISPFVLSQPFEDGSLLFCSHLFGFIVVFLSKALHIHPKMPAHHIFFIPLSSRFAVSKDNISHGCGFWGSKCSNRSQILTTEEKQSLCSKPAFRILTNVHLKSEKKKLDTCCCGQLLRDMCAVQCMLGGGSTAKLQNLFIVQSFPALLHGLCSNCLSLLLPSSPPSTQERCRV